MQLITSTRLVYDIPAFYADNSLVLDPILILMNLVHTITEVIK